MSEENVRPLNAVWMEKVSSTKKAIKAVMNNQTAGRPKIPVARSKAHVRGCGTRH